MKIELFEDIGTYNVYWEWEEFDFYKERWTDQRFSDDWFVHMYEAYNNSLTPKQFIVFTKGDTKWIINILKTFRVNGEFLI